MTARSKKVIDYAALEGADSEDDFSTPTPPQDLQPKKKSILSKKKTEHSTSVYSSTQMDEVNRPVGRGGRPIRKPPDEVQFEKDLEDALKMSETETESSGEIVQKNSKDNPIFGLGASSADTVLLDQEPIPIIEDEDDDFAPVRTVKKAAIIDRDDVKDLVKNEMKEDELIEEKHPYITEDTDDDFTPARTNKKAAVIDSDEDEVKDKLDYKEKENELAVPKLRIEKINKNTEKKRKIDDGWVISGSKKKKATNLKKYVKPLQSSDDEFEESTKISKPPQKIILTRASKSKKTIAVIDNVTDVEESELSEYSDEEFSPGDKQKINTRKKRFANVKQTKNDDVSDFEESSCPEDSDDEFDPKASAKKKTPVKKSLKKTPAETTPTVKLKKTTPSQIEKLTSSPVRKSIKSPVKSIKSCVKSTKSPAKPLGLHNIPENKPNALTPVMPSLKLARTPLSFSGPKLAKTPGCVSSHLNKLQAFQAPSPLQTSPSVGAKHLLTPSPMETKPKLGGLKIPAWTPPGRVGEASPRVGGCASPSLGLRLGLSRNMKVSKPLHSNVKLE